MNDASNQSGDGNPVSDFVTGITQTAIGQASDAAPGLGFAAGQGAVNGALSAIEPYLPFLIVGAAILIVAL